MNHQLELFLLPKDGRGEQKLSLTRALKNHRLCAGLLKRLTYVLCFFPELQGRTLRVGLTRSASGMAIPGGESLWLNPHGLSYHTITHELIHLLQKNDQVPHGERSCDLYSLARHWTLNDTPPYYVKIPPSFLDESGCIPPTTAKVIFEEAKKAIDDRTKGKRKYIVGFEEALRNFETPLSY